MAGALADRRFRKENRTEDGRGLARNPFHFTEGFGNPDDVRGVLDRALVRGDQGEAGQAVGGRYQVVCIIQLATELWDRDAATEQERIIGRRKDAGSTARRTLSSPTWLRTSGASSRAGLTRTSRGPRPAQPAADRAP
ncbi:hypothetical protein ACIOEZ_07425 [Streptomyces sp. NPDC087866]|uniref:hypothetical protein n=1 Tax=unclassified Streptomyces TaxID=2593676 RepID=UPI00338D8609